MLFNRSLPWWLQIFYGISISLYKITGKIEFLFIGIKKQLTKISGAKTASTIFQVAYNRQQQWQ